MKALTLFFFILACTMVSAQVKIRLYTDQSPESAVLTVISGKYEINTFTSEPYLLDEGAMCFIAKYKGKLIFKIKNQPGIVADSLLIRGISGDEIFSLRLNGNSPVKHNYSGNLKCFPDLETIVFVNLCDEDKYIAGVVMAEGGSGRNIEYFKTQAVLTRTYMYRYYDKHMHDGYNLCDNTHCQVFRGVSDDTILNRAVHETRGLVILDMDSTLIISAFHSNCGGETSAAEDVWLTGQPYLKKVIDPYCSGSRNSSWEVRMKADEWVKILKNSGYSGQTTDPAAFSFIQPGRATDYKTGSFSVPFRTLRTQLNLRSAFFSVIPENDIIILKGKGYGHGVGLCQEGAMVMASKGFTCRQIIDFYYRNVIVCDIKNARKAQSVY